MNAPTKRYVREFSITMTAYVVTIIGSALTVNRMGDSPWRVPVTLIPMIPVVILLIVFQRYLNAIDELQKQIQLYAIGFAAAATSLITFTYGFLENVGFPHVSPFYVFPMMVFLWGMSVAYYSKRYQ
jgi:hypothetical protein